LVQCGVSHTLLPSLRRLQISDHSQPPSKVQTDENQKVHNLDCMVSGRELQIIVPDGFLWYGQQNSGTPYDNLPLHVLRISGFISFRSISQYLTFVTVVHLVDIAAEYDEVKEVVHDWLRTQPLFIDGLRILVGCWTKCIEKQAEDTEK
jgi:hypothetical protein